MPLTASGDGQTVFEFPESVPARAATSQAFKMPLSQRCMLSSYCFGGVGCGRNTSLTDSAANDPPFFAGVT
eukprot:6196786-Pleurochrysis_carterae.AAC.1